MITIYTTIMPVILGGVFNMLFTKTQGYKKYAKPIDGGKKLRDGCYIFGENKTWVGFASMVVFTSLAQTFWGINSSLLGFEHYNDFYNLHDNTLFFNMFLGALLGFAYMVCELPNSFVKRRIGILPGKTKKSKLGILFFFIDQFDSVLGVAVVLLIFSDISAKTAILYILVGGFTHVAVNTVLLALKIRKNI